MNVRAAPVAAGGLWLGVLAAGLPAASTPWVVALGVGLLVLPLASRVRRPAVALALLAVATAAIGWGWGGAAFARVDASPLASAGRARLLGTLRTDPGPTVSGWSAVMAVQDAELDGRGMAVRGAVWLGGRGSPPDATRGDRIVVDAGLEVPSDPGFAGSLRSRGIVAAARVSAFRRVGRSSMPLVGAAQSFRALAGRAIERLFPPREAGLLLGLALGDDTRLDPAVARDFHATGLGHLLVVSGENVAMVLAPVVGLLAWFRVRPAVRFAVALLTVVFFVVLTGADPSVLRAGVMATLALIGVLLGRPRDGIALLASAVVVVLLVDPFLARAVGFQLSVGATAGMVLLAGPIADRLPMPRPVAIGLGATLAAQVFVTPLLLATFREVPLVTLPANLLAAPVVSPGLLLGLAAATTGTVSPVIGRALALLAVVPLRFLEQLADRLARAPVPWITSGGGPVVLVVGLAVAGAIALAVRGRLPRPAVAAAAAFLVVASLTSAIRAGPPDAFTVRFLDVGQGDAALLTSPAGATVLVDAGPEPDVVARELAAVGVHRLDVAVATHPHADHVEGFAEVLARFAVGVLLVPGCADGSPTDLAFGRAVREESVDTVVARAGDRFVVGDLRLDVLAPDRCWSGTNSDPNNDSIVLMASVGDRRVLLAADAERDAQAAMLDAGVDLRADILKVPHHGGDTSLDAFLTASGASVAVVSVGQPNDYGHPVTSVLAAITATGTRVVRTDRSGTITVLLPVSGPVVLSSA